MTCLTDLIGLTYFDSILLLNSYCSCDFILVGHSETVWIVSSRRFASAVCHLVYGACGSLEMKLSFGHPTCHDLQILMFSLGCKNYTDERALSLNSFTMMFYI